MKEGDWTIAELEGNRIISLELDPEATKAAKDRIEKKLAELRGRNIK